MYVLPSQQSNNQTENINLSQKDGFKLISNIFLFNDSESSWKMI